MDLTSASELVFSFSSMKSQIKAVISRCRYPDEDRQLIRLNARNSPYLSNHCYLAVTCAEALVSGKVRRPPSYYIWRIVVVLVVI